MTAAMNHHYKLMLVINVVGFQRIGGRRVWEYDPEVGFEIRGGKGSGYHYRHFIGDGWIASFTARGSDNISQLRIRGDVGLAHEVIMCGILKYL